MVGDWTESALGLWARGVDSSSFSLLPRLPWACCLTRGCCFRCCWQVVELQGHVAHLQAALAHSQQQAEAAQAGHAQALQVGVHLSRRVAGVGTFPISYLQQPYFIGKI